MIKEAQNEDDRGDEPVTVCDLGYWHILAPGLYLLGHCSRAIKETLPGGIVLCTKLRKGWTMGGEAHVIMLSRKNAAGIPATVKFVRSDRPASEDSDSRSVGLFPRVFNVISYFLIFVSFGSLPGLERCTSISFLPCIP